MARTRAIDCRNDPSSLMEECSAGSSSTSSSSSSAISEMRRALDLSKTPSEADILDELLRLQAADGRFQWGPGLQRILGGRVSLEEVLAAADRPRAASDAAWLTAVALGAAEAAMPATRDLWELAAGKAAAYLESCVADAKEREDLKRDAATFVKNLLG